MMEEQNHTEDTTTQNGGWGAFSAFKRNGSTTANKGFSTLTKLLIFLIPALLFATFYQYSVVKGSTFFGLSLRHNIDLESGLVGYWTFDGSETSSTTVTDVSGNGNDGTIIGAVTAIGKVGQSLDFDGSDDYVSVPTFNETFSEITITAWVRRQSGPAAYNGIVISRNFPNIAGILLSDTYPGNTLAYEWDGSAPLDSGLELPYDTWTFVALTVSPTLGKVYVGANSNLSSFTNAIAHVPNTFNELKIGVEDDSPSHWNGGIDDVRIYNRALSAREIEALYKQGEGSKISVTPPTIPALESGLIGHWTFDGEDTNSSTVADISGQGNDGTIYGAVPTIGKIGQAMRFDGDSAISLAVDPMASGNRTTCSWSKLLDDNMLNGTYQSILDSGYYTLSYYFIAGDHYISQTSNANNALLWQFPDSPVGKWHHICIIRPGGSGLNSSLYVDGVVAADGIDGNPQTFYDLTFGSSPVDTFTFTGDLDDVRIYDRLLSDSEITQLYNLGEGTKYNVTPTTYAPLENGLVAHLTFDGPDTTSATATDVSGNGNDGEIYQAKPTIGKIGQALQFDGVDDEVAVFIPSMPGTTDIPFTWSFWVNSSYDVDEIIGWGAARRCRLTNVYANLGIGCSLNGDEYVPSAVNSYTVISDGQWHHIVFTHNSGIQELYVDGQLEDTGSDPFDTSLSNITIGTRVFGNYFGGKIDDFRMYNRAITANEVVQLYNLGR